MIFHDGWSYGVMSLISNMFYELEPSAPLAPGYYGDSAAVAQWTKHILYIGCFHLKGWNILGITPLKTKMKQHGTWESPLWKGKSSSKPPFWGSMLVFVSVQGQKKQPMRIRPPKTNGLFCLPKNIRTVKPQESMEVKWNCVYFGACQCLIYRIGN